MNKKNEGVNCSVTNCIYHQGLDRCIADKIKVTNCNGSCEDTACKTFKPENK